MLPCLIYNHSITRYFLRNGTVIANTCIIFFFENAVRVFYAFFRLNFSFYPLVEPIKVTLEIKQVVINALP